MPGFRFGLWHFLVAVGIVCVACATLVGWSPLVGSLAIFAFFLVNCFGLAGAFAAVGNTRVFWIGAAVFGIAYWWTTSPYYVHLPDAPFGGGAAYWQSSRATSDERPELATDRLLRFLEETLANHNTRVGDTVMARWNSGSLYSGTIKESGPDGYLVAWTDGSSPTWVKPSDVYPGGTSFRATGHAVMGILLALAGGTVATMAFGVKPDDAKVESPTTVAAANTSPQPAK